MTDFDYSNTANAFLEIEEIVADPDPDFEHLGMRKCSAPGCDKWFPVLQPNHVYCRAHGLENRKADRHKIRGDRHKYRLPYQRPFVGFEIVNGGTNEKGQENCLIATVAGTDGEADVLFNDDKPPSMLDWFEFILSQPKHMILCSYALDYVVTMILRDLPEERRERLFSKQTQGNGHSPYTWIGNDYGIEYLPNHFFTVVRMKHDRQTGNLERDPGTARTINAVDRFFQKPFVKALLDWNVANNETIRTITRMIEQRSFSAITPEIRAYNELKCRLLAEMMTRYRKSLIDATDQLQAKNPSRNLSAIPTRWRGPGYIASRLHKSAGTLRREDRPPRPEEFENLAKEGYSAGRFENLGPGYYGTTIYAADINSAHPAAMPLLPCPAHTIWRPVSRPTQGALYIADLTFEHPPGTLWGGFPFRTKDGQLHWPLKGRGVYWSVEIDAAVEKLGATVTFHRVWQAEKQCDCAVYDWVPELYDFRKSLGKGTKGYGLKLGMTSLYGKYGQHIGAAPWLDIAAAGLITAHTRAKLIHAIAHNPAAIVMLATDAVYSLEPLPLDYSDALGAWELTQHPDLFIVHPGMYFFPSEKNADPKTSGLPQSVIVKNAPRILHVWGKFVRDFKGRVPTVAPTVPIALDIFIGLRLAHERKILPARVLSPCPGGDCDHQDCSGLHDLSFDWSNKRVFDRWENAGQRIVTRPIEGSIHNRSACYDPSLLTDIEARNRLFEAMPDHVQLVEK